MELKLKWECYGCGWRASANGHWLAAWPPSPNFRAKWMASGVCAEGEVESLEEAQLAAEAALLSWFKAGVEVFK